MRRKKERSKQGQTHVHVHCNWLCFYIALPNLALPYFFLSCTLYMYLGTARGTAPSAETPDQREEFWAPEDERLS